MEAAACARPATGYTYARREPEKTALFQVLQQHLLTFEQEWTDKSDGRTLPSFVTDELHKFLDCGILAPGFAHLLCKTCHERYVVPLSCKARAVCPSCLGRRMSEGTFDLTEHHFARRAFATVCAYGAVSPALTARFRRETARSTLLPATPNPRSVLRHFRHGGTLTHGKGLLSVVLLACDSHLRWWLDAGRR